MLPILEFLLFAGALVFLALPVLLSWRLVFLCVYQRADPPLADGELPRAAVILPLRGADASLGLCLRGLLDQDYPQFSLHIVIDSPLDPAWNLVDQVLAGGHGPHVNVRVDALLQPLATCTLKISALIQAVTGLDESVQVIAIIDADVNPPRTWLRTLVAPLADPQVGGRRGCAGTPRGNLPGVPWCGSCGTPGLWRKCMLLAIRGEERWRCPPACSARTS
jgi:cellulose synthase/poly-beta-1,6-N-acetylglucosamine synthase-like glycosyltransferase